MTMCKRILLLVALIMPLMMRAQYAQGDWRVHPYYVSSNVKTLIDTEDKVFYLVGNDLFCYDKAAHTSESYNKRNMLNDGMISNIYYNHYKKYLVVTYVNSDMDVITADGQVINLPDVKDAVLTGTKGINDVTFAQGRMFVATQFGLMVYDDDRMAVVEARLFSVNFSSVIKVGQWVVISYGNKVFAAKEGNNESYGSYSTQSAITSQSGIKLIPVGDSRFMVSSAAGLTLYTIAAGSDGKPVSTLKSTITTTQPSAVQYAPSGYIVSFMTGNSYIKLNTNGENAQQVTAAAELHSACPTGNGTVWAMGTNGLHEFGKNNYYKPDGIGIKVGAFYMTYNKDQNKVYLNSSSDNFFAQWGSTLKSVTQIFTYDGNHWEDVTPSGLPGSGTSANWEIEIDPLDPNTYVYSSRKYGVIKVTNGQIVTQYNASNSYFGDKYYRASCRFDSQGNLWLIYSSQWVGNDNVAVLPRAKYEKASCSKSDWILVDVPTTRQKSFNGSSCVISNDVKVFNSGGYQTSFVFWKEETLGAAPTIASYNFFQDQDGKSVTWTYAICMAKDNNGMVWAGLTSGLVAFDPTKAFDEDFRVQHMKVETSEGSGVYDYLLDGMQVNCIAVDAANRKWIGTNLAGLYLVSHDGTKILKHFTTDNSPLTSNTIFNVCCNTTTNSVFVLTPLGVQEYMCDETPAADNYDNVYVQPNPVRPDFTGMLTIHNLMKNSYVKITTPTGTVVKQLQSTSGLALWDCCDSAGERVPTGMYHVYATQSANGSNSKKVAEFLVVK